MQQVTHFFQISIKYIKAYSKNFAVQYILLSLFSMIAIEALSRRSIAKAFDFMISDFSVFLAGFLIILFILSVTHLFKKRQFWKYVVTGAWIIIAFISYIMFSFRLMPFSFNDLLLIPSTFTVIPKYLTVFQMILIAVLIIIFIVILVHLYRKTKKADVNIKRDIVPAICLCAVLVIYFIIAGSFGILDNRISGLINKYERNGFVYCYTSSIFQRGMTEPDDYSAVEVASIVHDVERFNTDRQKDANIIFLQLESFFDVNNVKELSYSENPIPVFNSLEKDYSHGFLTVPTFSAGTANTEFEVISGMNVDFLGIGEVAYRTVVKDKPVETVCHTLKNIGYSTHAIHNNSASFYNRKQIYTNLGFDTFTSLEYMYDVHYNALGWARDKVLATSITDCLDSTPNSDFIYTVGVQTHGTYPDNIEDTAKKIDVTGIENPTTEARYEYYLGQLKEVDTFVGELISDLKSRGEPTVLVIFGDHMPGFEVDDDDLLNESKYQTEYVIWSSFDTDCIIKDLHSYQLYSYVLDRLNIESGVISKLHRRYSHTKSDEYLKKLEIIQYDMLEGDGISYTNKPPYTVPTRMGVRDIKIQNAYLSGNDIIVTGTNFNEYSKISIDGTLIETEYVSIDKLIVRDFIADSEAHEIAVAQADNSGNVLSVTNSVTIK